MAHAQQRSAFYVTVDIAMCVPYRRMVKKSQMPKMSISRDLAYFKSKVCEIHAHARQCNMVASIPLGFVLAEGCDSETEFADHVDTCVHGRCCGSRLSNEQTSPPPHKDSTGQERFHQDVS